VGIIRLTDSGHPSEFALDIGDEFVIIRFVDGDGGTAVGLQVDVPGELQETWTARAAREGTTLDELVRAALAAALSALGDEEAL
jgi:hypothetical protein